MADRIFLSLGLVAPGQALPGALWTADADPAASAAVAARNEAWATRLASALEDLRPVARDRDMLLEEIADDRLSTEQLLRRVGRMLSLAAPWQGGTARLTVFDSTAELDLEVPIASAGELAALAKPLNRLVETIVEVTGFQPLLNGQPAAPAQAVAGLLAERGTQVARRQARARRERRLARAGIPSALLVGLAALLFASVMLSQALRLGTPIATAEPDRTMMLTVERLLPAEGGVLASGFALEGSIPGVAAPVRALVDRDTYLRAGPGARVSVAPTRDTANPWIALGMVERASPTIRLGDHGVLLLNGLVALLALLGWYVLAVKPMRASHPALREAGRARVTRTALLLGAVSAVALLVAWLRGG